MLYRFEIKFKVGVNGDSLERHVEFDFHKTDLALPVDQETYKLIRKVFEDLVLEVRDTYE